VVHGRGPIVKPVGMMPVLFLSHGAPPLIDDELWVSQLAAWAADLPVPKAIVVVSAHWEAAPLTIGSTTVETPLTYDFWGFPQRYYDVTYDAPGAAALAATIEALMPDGEPVAHDPDRRLDHGAYVPLTVMYPDADIPVLQISLPTLDPHRLLQLGERLLICRDHILPSRLVRATGRFCELARFFRSGLHLLHGLFVLGPCLFARLFKALLIILRLRLPDLALRLKLIGKILF